MVGFEFGVGRWVGHGGCGCCGCWMTGISSLNANDRTSEQVGCRQVNCATFVYM